VLPPGGLHGPEDRAHHRTADAHERDHDNEPPDGHRLGHGHPAAGLGLLLLYEGLAGCLLVLLVS